MRSVTLLAKLLLVLLIASKNLAQDDARCSCDVSFIQVDCCLVRSLESESLRPVYVDVFVCRHD
jgi:hypothetical protein